MAWNLSIKGNYFFAINTTSNIVHEYPKAKVRISKLDTSSTSFRFTQNGVDIKDMNDVEFSELTAENGTDFTNQATFETWKNANTGFNPASGGSGARTTISLGVYTDLNALNTDAVTRLTELHNDNTQVTIATVTDLAVYEWAGEDSPNVYPSGGMWFVRTNLNVLRGNLQSNRIPIADVTGDLIN